MIEKELIGIQKNIKLAPYTTFKIGGPADYFFVAKTKEDLVKAIKVARKFKLPFFILAGGSNLLISDKGFKGLVIKNQSSKFEIIDSRITTETGVALRELVNASAELGLTGFEWLVGIPGTIGGAVRGNAGAFGKSMADLVKTVEVLEIDSKLEIKNYKLEDCKLNYRNSIFKEKENLVILSIELQLEKGDKREIKENIKRYLSYRKEKHPLNFPSAGSIFKNPENSSAGKIIEQCSLKGKKIGQAQISEKHANFIINLGEAKAEDILGLINLIKREVKEKIGIELEEEIKILGF
jgi:UDP-N-acetylmuramate dehydrogenase